MKSKLPLVVAFVLLFAFALMLVAFRSLVVAVKAIVLNLLSVAAAYGVLVLVFQHGVGKGLLGFSSDGRDRPRRAAAPVRDPVRPLDGLPRVHPEPDPRGVRPRREHGRGDLARDQVDAGVVTSAAIVMVAVFAVFATLSMLFFKQFGVGLAAAILIDATIVRGVLLPASMKLLGRLELVPARVAPVASHARAWRAGCRHGGRAGNRVGVGLSRNPGPGYKGPGFRLTP